VSLTDGSTTCTATSSSSALCPVGEGDPLTLTQSADTDDTSPGGPVYASANRPDLQHQRAEHDHPDTEPRLSPRSTVDVTIVASTNGSVSLTDGSTTAPRRPRQRCAQSAKATRSACRQPEPRLPLQRWSGGLCPGQTSTSTCDITAPTTPNRNRRLRQTNVDVTIVASGTGR